MVCPENTSTKKELARNSNDCKGNLSFGKFITQIALYE